MLPQSRNPHRRPAHAPLALAICMAICAPALAASAEDKDKNAKGLVLERLKPVAFIDDHMKMLAQANLVPNRVWIDHGCSLETDANGEPWIATVPVFRTPSLEAWADAWLSALPEVHPEPSSRRLAMA